ncbi:MAG: PHP domain-containing protein [Bacteroidota bacterium]|nr:PHP domain-containing protein [Bacteroidota bacterium]
MNNTVISQASSDLHLHTSHSDGKFTTKQLLEKVNKIGLKCISIVDHDTINGIDEAISSGKKMDIEVIPGVELSTTLGDMDVHIIGYFIDYKNEILLEHLIMFREERLKRAKRIIDKLHKLKIPLDFELVLARAQHAALGRPHIANAMVENGFVSSYQEAFNQYIRNGGPAYEAKYSFSPQQAISLINKCGGVSFIAHPGCYLNEDAISELIKMEIDGIETVHPGHNPQTTESLKKIANTYFLLESGGSDFHGGLRDDEDALGKYTIPYKFVSAMKRRLFLY